jgi:CrcB protein
MQSTFLVFVGAGIGGVLRHGVNLGCVRVWGTAFPWGTLAVNVVGSLLMGVIAGWLAFKGGTSWGEPLRLFLTTGILGGFTTFSAFSLDAALLWQRGETGLALAYVLGSVLCSISALALGLTALRAVA